VSQIPSLRFLDLNFDDPSGGYKICSADVAAFAEYALGGMSGLEQLSLGLNSMEVRDAGLSSLGQALPKLSLRGLNLRLKSIDGHYAAITGTQGISDLFGGIGAIEGLQSLAIALHVAADADVKQVHDAMGEAFGQMQSLESLWLELQDKDLHADRKGLTRGLASAKALRLMHADVPCIPCGGEAPWQCSNAGTFSDVISGVCFECNASPRAEECNCWQHQSYGCSHCDLGNWAADFSECTNWPEQFDAFVL